MNMRDHDFWISFVQLDGSWCPILEDGAIDYVEEVFSLPDGTVVGEYDDDGNAIIIFKEFFRALDADVKFYRDPVESSNIVSIGHAPAIRLLDVEFVGGSVYRYFNVPFGVYQALMAADSHGKFLNEKIKGVFPFAKLPRD